MSSRRARFGVFGVVALLAWGAISVVRPILEHRAGEVIGGVRTPACQERVDSLQRGETVGGVLSRGGRTSPE